MSDRDLSEVQAAVKKTGGCDIDENTVKEQATWYSILNIMALTLGSGLGIPLDQNEMNSLLGNIGQCMPELPLKNVQMLKGFFKNGDPGLIRDFNQRDMSTWRWNPDSFDKTLVPQAQGWAILAETECAKLFGLPKTTESIARDLWREWNTDSMLMCAMARKQCNFAFGNLRNSKGLFAMQAEQGSIKITDTNANLEDQACMLWACSDIATLAGMSDSMNADFDVWKMNIDRANELFQLISENKDDLLNNSSNKVLAMSMAIPALIWYAQVTDTQDLRAKSLWLLRGLADSLVKAEDQSEMVGNTIVDAAAAMRALIDAFRVTKLKTYAEKATKIFNFIEGQWVLPAETYMQTPMSNEYTYNISDIGIIAGALNSAQLFLKDRINRELANFRIRVFFCAMINHIGLQMSMPGLEFLPEWLRNREPSEHFKNGNIPVPSEAGGEHGVAPVFAGEVSYNPQSDTWARRMMFDTPSAMHACCEFLWLNRQAVNGFPEIDLDQAPLAVRRAAGVELPAA